MDAIAGDGLAGARKVDSGLVCMRGLTSRVVILKQTGPTVLYRECFENEAQEKPSPGSRLKQMNFQLIIYGRRAQRSGSAWKDCVVFGQACEDGVASWALGVDGKRAIECLSSGVMVAAVEFRFCQENQIFRIVGEALGDM